jgi:hypothetical protein
MSIKGSPPQPGVSTTAPPPRILLAAHSPGQQVFGRRAEVLAAVVTFFDRALQDNCRALHEKGT